ncbi:META domain-containing protein [Erythrobacter dokdonensis]|uniref:META domain-containing protein n=1 Tax=Erythrobacter dokdonensis DSW-74 TaxID=1300349 RepID=A0A1A7BBZ7_9SPHN|nr:META domain-containing protein [Erythrobacter dokdonensis]OBV10048.1 META domain-containing protein [Erythrobacter dokdonensis DSW-74]
MLSKALVAGGALLGLTACATSSSPHQLTGSEWLLVAIDTSGSTTTLTRALQANHRLSFGEQGLLALQLDCNRGRASWAAGKPRNGAGRINIGPVASTRALCRDPSFGDQMASSLSDAKSYVLSADRRELVIETGALRFTFATAAE